MTPSYTLQQPAKEGKGNALPLLRGYRYSPLRSSLSQIRIFKLYPGGDDDIVSGKLIRAPQRVSTDRYAALSYCWGSSARTKAINCDDKRLMVTTSLYSALRRLRAAGFRRIWADAICINQSDDVEKAAQVQTMGQIYKRAGEVVCDLGEADVHTELAIEMLHIIISSLREPKGVEIIDNKDFEQYLLPEIHDQKWQALAALFRRPWFRRLWVQQELCLAKRAYMLWGDTFFQWEFLAQAVAYIIRYHIHSTLREMNVLSDGEAVTIHQISSMAQRRRELQEHKKKTLIEVVGHNKVAEATDPRDNIYAMLGLTVEGCDAALYVSYSEPTSFVYKRVSKYLIEKYGTDPKIGILLLYRAVGEDDGAPSWVTRWNQDPADMVMEFGSSGMYHATGETRPTLRIAEDNSSALVAGSIFDCIEKVTLPRKNNTSDVRNWHIEARAMVEDDALYPTGDSIVQEFVTTLIADSTYFKRLERDIIFRSYLAYTKTTNEYGIKYDD
jgi:hypothetical protein